MDSIQHPNMARANLQYATINVISPVSKLIIGYNAYTDGIEIKKISA